MIKCPKCKKEKHLILERPSWRRDGYDLDIQCNCTACNLDFTVVVEIGKVKRVFDIEEDKAYPFYSQGAMNLKQKEN